VHVSGTALATVALDAPKCIRRDRAESTSTSRVAALPYCPSSPISTRRVIVGTTSSRYHSQMRLLSLTTERSYSTLGYSIGGRMGLGSSAGSVNGYSSGDS
jgi:hypothetical protein